MVNRGVFRMVSFGQLSSRHCPKFNFNWSIGPVPRAYNDQFLGNIVQLNDELQKLISASPLHFWSSVFHNPNCQKVSCWEDY